MVDIFSVAGEFSRSQKEARVRNLSGLFTASASRRGLRVPYCFCWLNHSVTVSRTLGSDTKVQNRTVLMFLVCALSNLNEVGSTSIGRTRGGILKLNHAVEAGDLKKIRPDWDSPSHHLTWAEPHAQEFEALVVAAGSPSH